VFCFLPSVLAPRPTGTQKLVVEPSDAFPDEEWRSSQAQDAGVGSVRSAATEAGHPVVRPAGSFGATSQCWLHARQRTIFRSRGAGREFHQVALLRSEGGGQSTSGCCFLGVLLQCGRSGQEEGLHQQKRGQADHYCAQPFEPWQATATARSCGQGDSCSSNIRCRRSCGELHIPMADIPVRHLQPLRVECSRDCHSDVCGLVPLEHPFLAAG